MTKTNYEKMVAGEPHRAVDPELFEIRERMLALKAEVDAIPMHDFETRAEVFARLFGSTKGLCIVHPPFTLDYGCHIHLGELVFVNAGSVWLDSAPITLGDRTFVGPGVQFLAAGHPVRPEDRFLPPVPDSGLPLDVACTSAPITIGKEVWIGGGSIILQGVTIGDGAVVGAGSVVTKDIPARMVAVGNPARVIRSVDD